MKRKRMWRLLLLIAIVFTTNICNAQVQVFTNQVNNTKWQVNKRIVRGIEEKPSEVYHTVAFDMSTMSDSILISNKSIPRGSQHLYYISDEEPDRSSFNFDNVGVNSKGKYLVIYNKKLDEKDYYTIMSFTNDELVLFHKAKENTIPNLDVYITYKRVNGK